MGICCSFEPAPVTSKLILGDGRLQEFSYPVKVSQLLLHLRNSGEDPSTCSFICNSDDMDFDDFLTPVGDNQALLPGQLYFELPGDWLTRRLRAEEMASLAVKATAALKSSTRDDYSMTRGGGRWCFGCGSWRKRHDVGSSEIFPVVYPGKRREVESGEKEVMLKRRRSGVGRFSANLDVISEE